MSRPMPLVRYYRTMTWRALRQGRILDARGYYVRWRECAREQRRHPEFYRDRSGS